MNVGGGLNRVPQSVVLRRMTLPHRARDLEIDQLYMSTVPGESADYKRAGNRCIATREWLLDIFWLQVCVIFLPKYLLLRDRWARV